MRLFRCFLSAAACLAAASVGAEEPAADDWRFSVEPYIWATALNGDIAVRGRAADVDASFIDILRETDTILGIEGRISVRKGNWGAYVDGLYTRMEVDDNLTANSSFKVVNELAIVEAALLYRVGEWPLEVSPDATRTGTPSLALETYAGARYTNLSLDLDISDPLIPISASGDRGWVDPIIGARIIVDLSERWRLLLGGDIGGFGVGSDFTWSVLGLVGYDFLLFGSEATVVGGYKALHQDFDDGSGTNRFVWDTTLHGPITGLVIRF